MVLKKSTFSKNASFGIHVSFRGCISTGKWEPFFSLSGGCPCSATPVKSYPAQIQPDHNGKHGASIISIIRGCYIMCFQAHRNNKKHTKNNITHRCSWILQCALGASGRQKRPRSDGTSHHFRPCLADPKNTFEDQQFWSYILLHAKTMQQQSKESAGIKHAIEN